MLTFVEDDEEVEREEDEKGEEDEEEEKTEEVLEMLEDLSEVDAAFEEELVVCCTIFETVVVEIDVELIAVITAFEAFDDGEVVESVEEEEEDEEVLVILPEDDEVTDLIDEEADLLADEDCAIVVLDIVEDIVLIEDAGAKGPPIVIARSIGFGSESSPESLMAPSGVTSSYANA